MDLNFNQLKGCQTLNTLSMILNNDFNPAVIQMKKVLFEMLEKNARKSDWGEPINNLRKWKCTYSMYL